MKNRFIGVIVGWLVVLGVVCAVMGPHYSLTEDLDPAIGPSWRVPGGQPEQMRSKVIYDPKLRDTFFESDAVGYQAPSEDTARCFSTGFGAKHLVEFCHARSVDVNSIDLFIHYTGPGFFDRLKVQVRRGMFTCQYWTRYKAPGGKADLIWTTKRQELILDRKVYRKGDVIKGRIDFECVEKATNPMYIAQWPNRHPITIKVYGVFKTTVE